MSEEHIRPPPPGQNAHAAKMWRLRTVKKWCKTHSPEWVATELGLSLRTVMRAKTGKPKRRHPPKPPKNICVARTAGKPRSGGNNVNEWSVARARERKVERIIRENQEP